MESDTEEDTEPIVFDTVEDTESITELEEDEEDELEEELELEPLDHQELTVSSALDTVSIRIRPLMDRNTINDF